MERHDYHPEVRKRNSDTKCTDEEYRSSRGVDHHHHHKEKSSKSSRRRSRSSSRNKSDKYNPSRSRSRSRSQSPNRSHHKYKKDSHRHHHGSSSSRKYSDYSYTSGGSRDYDRDRVKRNRSRSKSKEKLIIHGEKSETKSVNIPPVPERERNFNAPAFDPSKLVEQVERRKLLFSKKDNPEKSTATWKQTTFQDDSDGKMTAKFKRLMGIKEKEGPSEKPETQKEESSTQQQDYFANLEKQYEVARATTHTQRGKGLGFGSLAFMPKPGE